MMKIPFTTSTLLALLCVAALAKAKAQDDPKRTPPAEAPPVKAAPDATDAAATPRQIGGIRFVADLDQAFALSAQDGKPVVAYFTFDT